jgi:hypothetical protein
LEKDAASRYISRVKGSIKGRFRKNCESSDRCSVAGTVAGARFEELVSLVLVEIETPEFISVSNFSQTGQNALYSILSLVRLPIPPLSHAQVIVCIVTVIVVRMASCLLATGHQLGLQVD